MTDAKRGHEVSGAATITAATLKSVAVRDRYEAYILPISRYPMPQGEWEPAQAFVDALCAKAAQKWNLTSEVFMQLEQLDAEGCREAFCENAPAWIPQTGLGVWVDRPPPQKWTKAELENFVPGDKLRPIMFQVFRVSQAQAVRVAARHAMLPYGPVVEILTPRGETYLQSASPIFKQGIVDPSYTCFPYYVGLMEAKSIANATTEQLHQWFEGITVYVRQSFEDKGILIASAAPLGEILEGMGGSRHADGWTFRP